MARCYICIVCLVALIIYVTTPSLIIHATLNACTQDFSPFPHCHIQKNPLQEAVYAECWQRVSSNWGRWVAPRKQSGHLSSQNWRLHTNKQTNTYPSVINKDWRFQATPNFQGCRVKPSTYSMVNIAGYRCTMLVKTKAVVRKSTVSWPDCISYSRKLNFIF